MITKCPPVVLDFIPQDYHHATKIFRSMNQDMDIIVFEMQLFLYANRLTAQELHQMTMQPSVSSIERLNLPKRFHHSEFREASILYGAMASSGRAGYV
jgi:hypothetical protein